MTSNQNRVVAALEAVLRDRGWPVATDPARLRATLSDLLGAEADEQRGALDAIVVSVAEGVSADLRDAGREGAGRVRAELVARLEDWGMAPERAAWVVDAWTSLLPETTATPPATEPPPAPVRPSVAPHPPTPLPPVADDVTSMPPVERELTSLPPLAAELTSLPPVTPTAADSRAALPAGEPDEPDDPTGSTGGRRARWTWLATGTAAVVVAGTWGALAATGDDTKVPSSERSTSSSSPSADTSTDASTDAEPRAMTTGRTIATGAPAAPRAAETFAIAGRVGGVRLTRVGAVDQVGSGNAARVAAPGSQLLGFSLANGPCEERPCDDWAKLDLKVSIDGTRKPLPRGGPDFVVAAPESSSVELVYAADGFNQRLSLVDGAPGAHNIDVLLRSDRTTQIGDTQVISPTVSDSSVLQPDLTVHVRKAELSFFHDHDGPRRPDRAYLDIDVVYTRPGAGSEDEYQFYPSETHFIGGDGTAYEPVDLDPADPQIQDLVFVVPANLKGGTLVIGGGAGRVATATDGFTYTLTIPRTPFPFRFGQAG